MSGPTNKSDQRLPRQVSLLIAGLMVLTLALICASYAIYQRETKGADPNAAHEVPARFVPASVVYAGNTGQAAMLTAQQAAAKAALAQVAYGGSTDGKTIYDNLCHSCHTTGVAGAPKLGDKAAWAPRIATGLDTLIKHATEGYRGPEGNFMPPRGGNPALNDAQVKAAVQWIIDHKT